MTVNNRASFLKRDIMIKVARFLENRDNGETLNRTPYQLSRETEESIRCCRHQDRAIIRNRVLAALGLSQEAMTDEYSRITELLEDHAGNEDNEALTVIHEACSSCIQTGYFVTNACKGCLARPCEVNCPVNAITFKDGHAVIGDNCINCGRCKKLCPYSAIIKTSAPCEEVCPVGAISRDENNSIQVDHEKCVLCGKCLKNCPFGAITERSHMRELTSNRDREQIALIAPSIAGQFPGTIGQVKSACLALGFDAVYEVADGAGLTAEDEAVEWMETIKEGKPFMTSSCCPSWIMTAEKYLPELKEFISTTPTPMQYTAEMVKEDHAGSYLVFIGPCLAKRQEALGDDRIDLVLTFEELAALFIAADVDVMECGEPPEEKAPCLEGRGFSFSGGVTEAVKKNLEKTEKGGDYRLKPHLVDGLTAKQIKLMKVWAKRKAPGNFIEVMACEGGCVCGPGTIVSKDVSLKALSRPKEPGLKNRMLTAVR